MSEKKERKVISISRRVEMVGFYPEKIVHFLQKKCRPERVHTLVFWTKHPENLLSHHKLNRVVREYDHLFIHLTITGMGGTDLEPGIPDPDRVIGLLPELVALVKNPERIRVRFDPVVQLKTDTGRTYSNLSHYEKIAEAAADVHINTLVFSWMQHYPKVKKHLLTRGYTQVEVTPGRRRQQWQQLSERSKKAGVTLKGCCEEGVETAACIDGKLLTRLHPRKIQASTARAGGQRLLCHCTKSWDIGWYYPCPGGCIYCYANPAL